MTKLIKDFLNDNNIQTLHWPPQSPDLNAIENLWSIIKRRRVKRFGTPKNKVDLVDQIFTIWEELDQELLGRLARSIEKRLKECLRLDGRSTKY